MDGYQASLVKNVVAQWGEVSTGKERDEEEFRHEMAVRETARLRDLRDSLRAAVDSGVTKKELADELGVARTTLDRMLKRLKVVKNA